MSVVLTVLILVFTDYIAFWIIGSQIKSSRLEDKLHFSVTPTFILNYLKWVWEYITFTVLTSSFLDPHALYLFIYLVKF